MLNRKQDLIIFSVKLKQSVLKTLQEDEAERERDKEKHMLTLIWTGDVKSDPN